jgi:hypothetical protein
MMVYRKWTISNHIASGLAGSTVVGFHLLIGSGKDGISCLASVCRRASCRKKAGMLVASTGTAEIMWLHALQQPRVSSP